MPDRLDLRRESAGRQTIRGPGGVISAGFVLFWPRLFFLKRPPVVALFLSLAPAGADGYALRYRRALAGSAVSFADLPTLVAIFD